MSWSKTASSACLDNISLLSNSATLIRASAALIWPFKLRTLSCSFSIFFLEAKFFENKYLLRSSFLSASRNRSFKVVKSNFNACICSILVAVRELKLVSRENFSAINLSFWALASFNSASVALIRSWICSIFIVTSKSPFFMDMPSFTWIFSIVPFTRLDTLVISERILASNS